MNNSMEVAVEADGTYLTPQHFISESLRVPTKATREKVEELLKERFKLENTEIETIISSAADVSQLKKSIDNPIKYHLGLHTYTYIELDVVTWRIFPSPENVRFEDERFGFETAERFGSLDSVAPVLVFNSESVNKLLDRTVNESKDIMQENPHTKTISARGIEVGGWLSLCRISANDLRPVGILESTDGFSRTVGAHDGLTLSPRDALLKLTNAATENDYRRELIELRDRAATGQDIGLIDETRLRCSVMRRARIIVAYDYNSQAKEKPKFDKARRTLVGHLHLAPQHGFSQSTNSATKANEICVALETEGYIPQISGLTQEQVIKCLNGNLEPWLTAGLHKDQYAPFILSSYRPNLNTRQGKAIKTAIENLTGQTIKSDELAEIASEVALRAIVRSSGIQKTAADQMVIALRSVLGKTWQSGIFSGVTFTNRDLEEIYKDAVSELDYEIANTQNRQGESTSSRAELAAMASFVMVAVAKPPLLTRAVGRKGFGNNDEPAKVMNELLRLHVGLAQLKQTIVDLRAGTDARVVEFDEDKKEIKVIGSLSSPEAIKEIYLEPQIMEEEYEKSPIEILNSSLRELAHKVNQLDGLVVEISQIKSEQGVSILSNEGTALEQEVQMLDSIRGKLSFWNQLAETKMMARMDNNNEVE
jgi:hypothetical protein